MGTKPLGHRNNGSIPHLPDSRMGPSDRHCEVGQARIATEKARDQLDEIFVQEKLDGSNVGVARLGDEIVPLGRAGYTAASSDFEHHQLFHDWAIANTGRFKPSSKKATESSASGWPSRTGRSTNSNTSRSWRST